MDDDDALQCPSSSRAGDIDDFGDFVTDNWARCDIRGCIAETSLRHEILPLRCRREEMP